MLKIAMLGADSSHTEAYAELMNIPDSPFYGRAKVVSLWGEDQDQARQKARQTNIESVAKTPEAALQDVDLVMVESRYGEDHYPLAKLAIEAGIPTFIDKPITNSLQEAQSLADLAKTKQVPLFSCSPLRYAVEVLALQQHPDFSSTWRSGNIAGLAAYPPLGERANNIYFYGVHMIELLVTIFGRGVVGLQYAKGKHTDVVIVQYEDARTVTINLLRDTKEIYHVACFVEQRTLLAEINAWGDFYIRTLEQILTFGETKRSPIPFTETLEIMRILDAIDHAKGHNDTWIPLD